MTAVIHGDYPVPGVYQWLIREAPVEVRVEHPTVKQQHRRAIAATVTDEELAATRDRQDSPGGNPERSKWPSVLAQSESVS
jgi:hypothetical protein